jgi:hypothetical protein
VPQTRQLSRATANDCDGGKSTGTAAPGTPFNREDVVEVPLSDPASASVIGSFSLWQMPAPDGRLINTCHDMGVILGSVDRDAYAGNPGRPPPWCPETRQPGW